MRRVSLLLFPFVLAIPQQLVAQDDVASYVRTSTEAAMNNAIASTKWPSGENAIGFKGIVLGMPFPISNNGLVHASRSYDGFESMPSNDEEPFMCTLSSILPMFDCRLILWNDPHKYPQALQDLQTAFGSHVRLNFVVLLSHAVNNSNFQAKKFGGGRVGQIDIEAEEPGENFVKNAVDYFTAKLGTSPKSEIQYSKPQEVYSSKCQAIVSGLYKKPRIAWSQADEDSANHCNLEAFNSIATGKLSATRTNIYSWILRDRGVAVSIDTKETVTNVGTGLSLQRSHAHIRLTALGVDAAGMKRIAASAISSFQQAKTNNQKKDF